MYRLNTKQYLQFFILLVATVWNQQALAQSPYTWGYNAYGQLGNGTHMDGKRPAKIKEPLKSQQVVGGEAHSLALTTSGKVWGWGDNYFGQLGLGTTTRHYTLPTQVSSLTDISQIAAGSHHSLALQSNGTVWAWGDNASGQLGNGTLVASNVPVQVSGLSGVIQISAGESYSLALKLDGTVWAWGNNDYGQLGNETNTNSNVPVQTNISNAIQISGGGYHALALRSDSTVWAWGYNYYGQLGNGTNIDSNTPIQTNIGNATQVAAGGVHSLVLKPDRTVWAWGYNGDSELGDGTNNDSNLPVQVSKLTGVASITTGSYHSLALKNDETVWAWGANYKGELGNGTTDNSSVPLFVTQDKTVISVGGYHSLALNTARSVSVTVPNGTIPYGLTTLKSTVLLNKTLFPMVGRAVTFTVDSQPVATVMTDAAGVATAPPMLLNAGKHKVIVSASASGIFYDESRSGTLTITKSDTTIKVDNVTMVNGETKNLSATLKQDWDSTPLKNAPVTFSLDGKTLGTANTDASGVATFSYTADDLATGSHKIVVRFAGDSNHLARSGNGILKIAREETTLKQPNATAKSLSNVTVTATLTRNSDGAGLANKTVFFYVRSSLVGSGITDSNGIATVTFLVDAPRGAYRMKVEFAGDNKYYKSRYSSAYLTVE